LSILSEILDLQTINKSTRTGKTSISLAYKVHYCKFSNTKLCS